MNNLVYAGLTCPSGTIGTVLRYHDILRFINDFIFLKNNNTTKKPFQGKRKCFQIFSPLRKKMKILELMKIY